MINKKGKHEPASNIVSHLSLLQQYRPLCDHNTHLCMLEPRGRFLCRAVELEPFLSDIPASLRVSTFILIGALNTTF